jgi:peptide/nickel transport system substrate-binding protein
MFKKVLLTLAFVLALPLALAACSEPQVMEVTREVVITETITETVTEIVDGEEVVVEVTRVVEVPADTPEVEEPEAEVVDRRGGWLDTIVFVREPDDNQAVARLLAGDIDMYPSGLSSATASQAAAEADGIEIAVQYGLYYEIFFNVANCTDESALNPFTNAKIREAMNWAIDRDYVADEIYSGNAVPKFTAFSEAGVDRGNFAPEIRSMEAYYAYNLEQATEVISAEMEAMGAELVNGVWSYEGSPINLVFLIRSEASPRAQKGQYVAAQLEDMGFQVEQRLGTSSDLGPLWVSSEPTECLWHLYTGGWSQTAISRNDASSFNQMYLPEGYPIAAWQVFDVPERMTELITRLVNNDYADLEERAELFREVLPMTLEQSYRVWVISQITPVPYNDNVQVTSDLAAGIQGARLWARTARFVDQVGGSMTIGIQNMFVEPWNPIGGSNWVFDAIVKSAISEQSVLSDPNLGIGVPNRIEGADLAVREGTTLFQTSDWVNVSFEPEITVPDDAWAGWDPVEQVFLTAAEVYTETQTAVFKSTAYYTSGFDGTTWHDGSPFTAADIVMAMITQFDLPNPESAYHDPAQIPSFNQFMTSFKGIRIVSEDPLVVEYYADNPALDAENSISTWWPYSSYSYGDAAWHNMALMLRLEANGLTAFSPDKATEQEIEWVSLIAGPSLALLGDELALSAEEGFIPYEATLGQYITADEAAERYANLAEFARRFGHYYIGTGPYFLQGVFPTEKQAVLSHFSLYPDPADRFSQFAAPPTAIVDVDGSGRVTMGDEAVFDVFIDYFLGPYPVEDIRSVTYLLFDSTGEQVASGQAEAVEDGWWEVVLDGETTQALGEGSNRLEIVVVSEITALPGLGQFSFVTAP